VLVGATASGKSHWAARWFPAACIVSSDSLRAVVGVDQRDMRASADAFEVLELIVAKRLARRLTTVIDTTGLDAARRTTWLAAAGRARMPAFAVLFDTDRAVVRARNRERSSPVPAKVVSGQLAAVAAVPDVLRAEGWASVLPPSSPVSVVPPALVGALDAAERQRQDPRALKFGLQISRFDFPGHPADTGEALALVARAAEDAGFAHMWLMDHFLQIPQVGREWEDMLESYTTLGYLAGVTTSLRLGTLVTGVTYRRLPHLAKIIATLDVLSGGRAMCGIGAAWFSREHELYGWEFPALKRRFELLEDALQLLPLMWGPGSPAFEGRTLSVAECICYPRPVSERIPILVGGGGEKKTLRLVAEYADMCNLFGDASNVRHKVAVLRGHCLDVGRDPGAVEVTHTSQARVIASEGDRSGPGEATVAEHIGRIRELAEAGVQTEIIGLSDAAGAESVAAFAPVIEAFAS
jgi:F420-dependent oxidoreductase-like protein